MTGSKKKARAMGRAMVRLGGEMGWQNTTVAEIDGMVVGVLQPASGGDGGVQAGPRLALHALRIVGPFGIPGLLRRMKLRGRLNFARPEGSYHVAELHVDASHRGQGIGGALLQHAEEEAQRLGHKSMSLVTATSNPARRLYERNGYEITDEKSDAEYEAHTGSAGRILMVKRLSE